jgi:DNA modification methylase
MADKLKIEYVALDEVVRFARNPKQHDEPGITNSIERFDFNSALEYNEHPEATFLLAGHGRCKALVKMREAGDDPPGHIAKDKKGRWMVPIVRLNLPPGEAEAYSLAHNQLTVVGDPETGNLYDEEELAGLVADLDSRGVGLGGLGWSDEELSGMLTGLSGGGDPPPPPPPPDLDRADELQKKWGVKPGDLWQLGNHRLLCGDCTDAVCVQRVLNGVVVDSLITDPPYGVDYSSKNDFLNQYDKGSRVQKAIANDAISDYRAFFASAFRPIPFAEYNTIYVFMQGKRFPELAAAFDDVGFYRSQELIWVKNNHVLGRQDYSHKHEMIFYGWKGKHRFYRGFTTTVIDEDVDLDTLKKDEVLALLKEFVAHFSSVIRHNKPNSSPFHPTTKPAGLVGKLIIDGSIVNAVVYDPFLGSGTTLMACEQLARRCCGIELAPEYCSVVLERYLMMTGLEPKLLTNAD